MGLFGKKKEPCCSCSSAQPSPAETDAGIKVLGSGCPKCQALEASARAALAELGMDPAVDHVTDFVQIASYGVMSTPALVVDGKVVSCGKVLSQEEARDLIRKARG